jgi:hypothetical protein
VYTAAPRLERRLADGLRKLDDPREPMAETYRRIRNLAAQLGVPRPSYERARLELRRARLEEGVRAEARALALELAIGSRPADHVVNDLLDLLGG